MEKTIFYVGEGKEIFWPEIGIQWEIVDYLKCDIFDTCTALSLQHYDTGLIVHVDAENIEIGKGKGTITASAYGQNYIKNFGSIDDKNLTTLTDELSKVIKWYEKAEKDGIAQFPEIINNWNLKYYNPVIDIRYEKRIATDEIAIIQIDDIDNLLEGETVKVTAEILINWGLEQTAEKKKSWKINNIKEINNTIKKYDEFIKKD